MNQKFIEIRLGDINKIKKLSGLSKTLGKDERIFEVDVMNDGGCLATKNEAMEISLIGILNYQEGQLKSRGD